MPLLLVTNMLIVSEDSLVHFGDGNTASEKQGAPALPTRRGARHMEGQQKRRDSSRAAFAEETFLSGQSSHTELVAMRWVSSALAASLIRGRNLIILLNATGKNC